MQYAIVLEDPPMSGSKYIVEKIYESEKHAILGEKCFVLSKQATDPDRIDALYEEGIRFLKPSKYSLTAHVRQGIKFEPSEEQLWKRMRVQILNKIRRSRVE